VFDRGICPRSFCPFSVFRFGSRAARESRLRLLSERDRGDRGCCDHRSILKKVPDGGLKGRGGFSDFAARATKDITDKARTRRVFNPVTGPAVAP